jgi:hypothetical protein
MSRRLRTAQAWRQVLNLNPAAGNHFIFETPPFSLTSTFSIRSFGSERLGRLGAICPFSLETGMTFTIDWRNGATRVTSRGAQGKRKNRYNQIFKRNIEEDGLKKKKIKLLNHRFNVVSAPIDSVK